MFKYHEYSYPLLKTTSESMRDTFEPVHGSPMGLPYVVLRKANLERRREERRRSEQRRVERRIQENKSHGKRQATIDELRRYLQLRGIDDSHVAPHAPTSSVGLEAGERHDIGQNNSGRRIISRHLPVGYKPIGYNAAGCNPGRRSEDRRATERRRQERRSSSRHSRLSNGVRIERRYR